MFSFRPNELDKLQELLTEQGSRYDVVAFYSDRHLKPVEDDCYTWATIHRDGDRFILATDYAKKVLIPDNDFFMSTVSERFSENAFFAVMEDDIDYDRIKMLLFSRKEL